MHNKRFSENEIEKRAKHLCVGYGSYFCGFFGFDGAKDLEDKVYGFLDELLTKENGPYSEYDEKATEIREAVVEYFKAGKIANVMFNFSGGFYFHKLPF